MITFTTILWASYDRERGHILLMIQFKREKMENQLSVSTMGSDNHRRSNSRDRAFRRHSSSTCTPPRSPIFLIHKPPSTPGDLGSTDSNISDKHLLSPLNRRFSTKKVCTMDCPNCRNMAAQKLRAESPNHIGFLSAPCSRKASMASGKKPNENYLRLFETCQEELSLAQ